MIRRFLREESGSSILEYAFIAGAIAAATIGLVAALGLVTSNNIGEAINGFAGIGQNPP